MSRYLLVRNNLLCKQSILLEAEVVNGAMPSGADFDEYFSGLSLSESDSDIHT